MYKNVHIGTYQKSDMVVDNMLYQIIDFFFILLRYSQVHKNTKCESSIFNTILWICT